MKKINILLDLSTTLPYITRHCIMGIDKLGLFFLLNSFDELKAVRNHLGLALKEVLLAMNSSVDILHSSSKATPLGDRSAIIESVFKKLQSVLRFTINKVDKGSTSPNSLHQDELKDIVVQSIISAIDDEIESIQNTNDERSQLKVEALDTVKKVLQGQKNKKLQMSPLSSSKNQVA